MKKRGVLSLWKVIMLVFASLIGVAGVSVLGVYLSGGFNEKHIDPQDMSFDTNLSEGEGYYNTNLGQYEVASDFKLVIRTTTEGVTEKKVTLSLKNTKVSEGGYISDGIIRVPQIVSLNTPFSVTLEKGQVESFDEWVKGGTSVLTAKSSNILLTAQTAKIAVDVPVSSINVGVKGIETTGETLEVVVGTTFELETAFTPSASRYLFSDSSREKNVYFANSSAYIHYDWTNGNFVADRRSGNATDTITVYTFANSYYQKTILESITAQFSGNPTDEEFSSAVTSYLSNHPEACISKTVALKVLDIDVASVEVGNNGNIFSMYLDQYHTVTAASANGDNTLNVSIKDSKNNSLNSLMGNVGIKISKETSQLAIYGGQVVKVVKTDDGVTITKENFGNLADYYDAPEGTDYYVLPNSSPKEFGDYFWRFAASAKVDNVSLKVNFFYEDEDGNLKKFFETDSAEKEIVILAEEHDYEEDPAWTRNDAISMTINFDGNGNTIPSHRDLAEDLNPINKDNIYKTVRYFLFIDQDDENYADINVTDVFTCKAGIEYAALTDIQGAVQKNGYILYELDGSVLTAVQSFAGKVKVIAMTIKTDADSKPYVENGRYQIVKVSRAKEIKVESTLSIVNLDPKVSFGDGVRPNAQFDNDYYISAINRNADGSQKTMITFELTLSQSKDTDTDKAKVIAAFNSGDLTVVCLDKTGKETNGYVTLQGLADKGFDAGKITFQGTLAIEENFFAAGRNSLDKGVFVRLQLKYNDGKDVHKKIVTVKNDEEKDYFYIYYQQPTKVEFEYAKDTVLLDKDGDGVIDPVEVNITATSGVKIGWGNKDIADIDALNDMFAYKLTDQYNNQIDANSSIYSIRLEETLEEGYTENIIGLDSSMTKIQTFISTQGQTRKTYLTVYVVDKDGNRVNIFDENGNVTQQQMKSDTITFNIASEGVSKLEYATKDVVIKDGNEEEYANSTTLSQATVRKYVTTDDEIDIPSLLKVYTKNAGDEDTLVEDVVYKFDNDFISGLSAANKKDIMKMFNVLTADDGGNWLGANAEDSEYQSIEALKNKNIVRMKILSPFKEDTQVVFSVRDKNETLFDISLVLVLKSDITISQSFNLYYEANKDYLVQEANAIGVFAGESYNLDEYVKLNSYKGSNAAGDSTYTWKKGIGAVSLEASETGVFNANPSNVCSLSNEAEGIILNIADIYNFTVVRITLYYGFNSFYACNITFTLYVNPNILVKVNGTNETPYINLEKMINGSVGENISDKYNVYRLTNYIKNGTLDPFTLDEISYVNNSTDRYVKIGEEGKFYYETEASSINFTLGQTFNQVFKIRAKSGDTAQEIDAVLLFDDGQDKKITLCDAKNHLSINFSVGYGELGLEEELASTVFANTVNVKTLIYNGETNLLLKQSTSDVYKMRDGFTINKAEGSAVYYSNNKILCTRNITGFMSVGNLVNVERTLSDSVGTNLKIIISLNAIVTKVGEKFVYYNNGETPEDEPGMIFNSFGDVDFAKLTSSNYTDLQDENIYQILEAGKEYKIVHNSVKPLTDLGNSFGFYYDGDLSGIEDEIASYRLSIVEDATGYVTGLATLAKENDGDSLNTVLKISHLENSYQDAYIVLRFEIYEFTGTGSLTWYYRIKVNPSFTVGKVSYPYSENGEYLNEYSSYYDSVTENYVIDFSENFTAQNSNNLTGKRFADVEWKDAENSATTLAHYAVKSATINGEEITDFASYFNFNTYENEGDYEKVSIKLVDTNAKITIILERTLYVDGIKMIGSEMQYRLMFNQGANYIHSLKADSTTLTAKNNVYDVSIKASATETVLMPSIMISSNGTESKVEDFNAYISGTTEELSSSLKFMGYVKKGAKLYSDEGTTEVETLDADLIIGTWLEAQYSDNYVEVTKDANVYYVSKEDIAYTYAYLDDSKKLHVRAKDKITQDKTFEIGFYTDERVVFKVNLTVTSYFEYKLNDSISFMGGKQYDAVGEDNGIFASLTANKSGVTAVLSNINLTGENNRPYTYKKATAGTYSASTQYYVLSSGQYTAVETSNADDFGNYYVVDLYLSDLFKFENGKVEFAHLTENVTFNFTATINGEYSFDFTLEVKASFNINTLRRYMDTNIRYGAVEFDGNLDIIQTSLADLMPKVESGKTEYVFEDGTTEKTITPEEVNDATICSQKNTILCKFDGKTMFSFEVEYRYTTRPNVKISANYPAPDGKNVLDKEYLSATGESGEFKTDTISDFFGSKALFGLDNRITVETLAKDKDGNDVPQNWTITVSSISNAKVNVNGNKIILSDSADKLVGTATNATPNVNLTFSLIDSSRDATVTFDVIINKVTVNYTVVIVATDVIQVSTNAPNYLNNKEVIYAEDLAKQSDKNLFKQNRIVNYTLKSSVTVGTEYYLRYINTSGEVKVVSITAKNVGETTNIDVGESMTGYVYKATYTTKSAAESGLESSVISDETIYEVVPTLTSRIVIKYYDGSTVAFGENVTLSLRNENTHTKADEVALSSEDFHKDKAYNIEIGMIVNNGDGTKSTNYILTSSQYVLYLDIEFAVDGNADSAEGYTTVEINAGTERPLLSYTSFGIKNARTGLLYNQDSMYASGGSFSLSILGFSDTKISQDTVDAAGGEETELGKQILAAMNIHNKLTRKAGEDLTKTIIYSTGLSPRAGAVLNSVGSNEDLTKNYITLSGILKNGKTVDYNINAQGANNDGNHVMMRVTYTVNVGLGNPITSTHNILFKVLPNSTMRFKSQNEDSQIFNNASTEIVDGQTVASNYVAPYDIVYAAGDSFAKVNFWTNKTTDTGRATSVIVANMYGKTANSASKFKYSYNKALVKQGYNEKTDKLTFGCLPESVGGWNSDSKKASIDPSNDLTSVYVDIDPITLGTTGYIFELENDFGYKAKFYIKISANENPTIYSAPQTLKEGDNVAVGLRYQTVTPAKDVSGVYQLYRNIVYTKKADSNDYANVLKITGKDNIDTMIMEATLTKNVGELTAGSKIYKTFTMADEVNIVDGSDDKSWRQGIEEASTKVTSITSENLEGASCVIYVKAIESEGVLNSYKIEYVDAGEKNTDGTTYKNVTIDQVHTPSSDYKDPLFGTESGETEPKGIILTGITAFGYENTYGGIDLSSIMTSRVHSIFVKNIEFYYGEQKIGTCSSKSTANKYLITNKGYSFSTDGANLETGKPYTYDERGFTVPVIDDSYLYGSGNALPQVKMVITLTDAENNTCQVTSYVALERKQDLSNIFSSEIVYDGSSPSPNSDASEKVYNDTLEVELKSGESVSLVVNNNEITGFDTDARSLEDSTGATKIANIIALTNNKAYTVKEYVGISTSIVGLTKNLDTTSKFYIMVVSKSGTPRFFYNGTTIAVDTNGKASATIAKYDSDNSLRMNIENVAELNNQNYKAETLYFLYNGEKVYQTVKTFNVYPIYYKAATNENVTEDQEYIKVNSYLKISNGTNSYYVMQLSDWATGINLYNKNSESQSLSGIANQYYRLHYEINTSTGGSGSAFIDETGLITTTEDFDIVSHTITVNVYCKVSGYDGNFEDINTRLKLGSFRLYLNAENDPTRTITSGGKFVSVGNSVLTIPTGYTLYGSATTSTIDTNECLTDTKFSVEVGNKVNFAELFKLNLPNVNYHLVSYKKSGTTTYVNFNNVNAWTFSETGTYEIEIVAVSRSSAWNIKSTTNETIKIFVYDTSVTESQSTYGLTNENINLDNSADNTWYDITDGQFSEETTFASAEIGIFTKEYVVVNASTNTSKLVSKNFFVYGEEKNVSVALNSKGTFQLSDLVELDENERVDVYKIIDTKTITKRTSESFANAENTYIGANYIAVIKEQGVDNIKKIVLYNVTYKFTSSTINKLGVSIVAGADKQTAESAIEAAIQKDKGIDSSVTVSLMNDSGVTSAFAYDDKGENLVTQKYFVEYTDKNGSTKFAKYEITFFVYQSGISISKTVSVGTTLTLATSLNDEVKTNTGNSGFAGTISYYTISGASLQNIEEMTITKSETRECYALVNGKYYKITLSFTAE